MRSDPQRGYRVPGGRPSLSATGALVCGAVAVWVSFGALTFLDTTPGSPYVGILPSPVWLFGLLSVAALITIIVRPPARTVAPLWLSAVMLLPWLPLPLPAAAFIWTGHVGVWLFVVIAGALIVRGARVGPRTVRSVRASEPRTAVALAGVLSLVACGVGAWRTAPQHPSGDEPHYLIITQSLLKDHDLQIENNHRQHDYYAYFGVDIAPDMLRRGANGAIYSVHAPGLPLLVAPFFAALGYRGVVAALVLLGALAGALVWSVAWRVTRDAGASWFAWAAVFLSAPYFLLTSSVFPDGPGAVLTLAGALPIVDRPARTPRRLLFTGAALATLPWLHTRFAVLAAAMAGVILGRLMGERDRARQVAALLFVPVLSAVAWFSFFQIIYGTPDPSAPYGGSPPTTLGNIAGGVLGLLVDQKFGLLTTAPVYVCAVAGLALMWARGERRLAIEWLVVCAPYVLVVSLFSMWWGGTSTPARFLGPLTLLLAVPVARWFSSARSAAARVFSIGALSVSLLITATMVWVRRGEFVFSSRDGLSPVAGWLTPVVAFAKALPSLFDSSPALALVQAGVWMAALGAAIAIARMLGRRVSATIAFGLALEAGAMIAATIVWRTGHIAAATPGSGGSAVVRRYSPGSGQIALAYRPFRHLPIESLTPEIPLARMQTAGRSEWSSMSHLPPAVYEVTGALVGRPAGHVRIATDRRSPAIADWDVSTFDTPWKQRLSIPVGVPGLRIDLDEQARKSVRDLTVRAVAVVPRRERWVAGQEAGHGARYGAATFFNMSGASWMEPDGIWVGGGAGAELIVEPDERSPIRLLMRNGAGANEALVTSGTWRLALVFAPGEEINVDDPIDANRSGTPLRVVPVRGFRPVDLDAKSADDRLLGLWITTR